MNQSTTLQQADNQRTITDNSPTITLPTVIRDVKRQLGGFRVLSEDGWKFYARACLSEAQIDELEDWLEELKPGKRAA